MERLRIYSGNMVRVDQGLTELFHILTGGLTCTSILARKTARLKKVPSEEDSIEEYEIYDKSIIENVCRVI